MQLTEVEKLVDELWEVENMHSLLEIINIGFVHAFSKHCLSSIYLYLCYPL
jgi:hypothetical protein